MQNIKGAFDLFGLAQGLRQKIQNELRDVFELYDYESMDSTILNELEILTSKYAGGDEILKEMYQLTDQGKRQLGLRYDLTIPFAKVISRNPSIELPYKRYEIGKVFRDGPTKRGRLREFIQCDVDVVGISGPEAEAELLLLAIDVFKRLNLAIIIRWNNRCFLSELLQSLGVNEADLLTVMLTLDKKDKIGDEGIKTELSNKGLPSDTIEAIDVLLTEANASFEKLCNQYNLIGSKGATEVVALMSLLEELQLSSVCRFDPFISRGLSFYTGTVYEIFDATGSYTSSLSAGGRYDNIIGQLIGESDLSYPAVGISFGIESIVAILEQRNETVTPTVVTVIPIGDTLSYSLQIATALRQRNIRTKLDTSQRKLRKKLTSLSHKQARYVVLIGEDEKMSSQIVVRDLQLSTQYTLSLEEAIIFLKNSEELN